jgi:predicted PurR-regulated permease PerM
LLVWVPAGIYLIVIGKPGHGIGELVFAALLVGIGTDYVIRPRLVGHHKGMPTLLTFMSLFGGIEVFGVLGLILGPVIVTLCVAVLRTYEQASQDRAADNL